MVYAYSETLRAAHQPRRGRARQGLAAAQDAGRPLAAARRRPRAARLPVDAPRQAAAVHGQRVRAADRVGRVPLASTGGCSTTPPTRASCGWSRDLNRVYKATPALWQLDHDPDGFEWIDSDDAFRNTLAFLRKRLRRRAGRRRHQLRRRPPRGLPPRPAPRPAAGARSSTPTPSPTAAPASATSARSRPCPSPTTAARTPPRSASPRWAWSSSRPADRGLRSTGQTSTSRGCLGAGPR